MKNLLLLLCFTVFCTSVYAQDLVFSTAVPAWTGGDVFKTYTNVGDPQRTVIAIYSGNLNFAGSTFPQASASGLRTQVNHTTNTQKITFTTTFDLSVSGLTFNISEIDKATNNVNYIDRVIVTGFDNGVPQDPIISNVSVHASVTGNVVTGISADLTTTPTTFTFPGDIDQVVIEYDNADGTQANPSNQEINIGNMNWDTQLPVRLVSFSVIETGNQVRLNWLTSSEENNAFFNIQRTNDFNDIQTIGNVPGYGNSNAKLQYSWTDETPLANKSYYRLEQVDFDGTKSHSRWVAVGLNQVAEINVFPNPVIDGFYIDSPKKISRLYIQDVSGKTLKEFPSQHYYTGLKQLQSGNYIINALMEDGTSVRKMVAK